MMHAKIENTMMNAFITVVPRRRSNTALAHKIAAIQRGGVLIKVLSLSSLSLSWRVGYMPPRHFSTIADAKTKWRGARTPFCIMQWIDYPFMLLERVPRIQ